MEDSNGTCQLNISSPPLHVGPLPPGEGMECPSSDTECSSTVVHTVLDSVSLDEKARMKRRARNLAKSTRRQLQQDCEERLLIDSVEKGIFHVCSGSGCGESLCILAIHIYRNLTSSPKKSPNQSNYKRHIRCFDTQRVSGEGHVPNANR